MEQHSFGTWLKLKRKALDLTREELAQQVGYSAATIRKIEDEERHPSAQVVERLAAFFKISENDREAFLRFARGDWKSAPVENKENIPWQSATKSVRLKLPYTTTSLIGREKEINDVRGYLSKEDIRLVTLLGPPGIGKTRLSIEAARAVLPDFPDGVFFVALAPLDDPNLIAPAIAQSLGYVGAKNISTTEQLKEGIADKHLLLVMDNCEHLIEAVAFVAADLFSACPYLKIIATSRESLRIPGEWLYTVPAFDFPAEHTSLDVESAFKYPALLLFAERARAVRSDFSLNADNIETVTAICARLDGLPLAIELIAARMRMMSPQALLDRLSSQFVLTADGMRAATERQKTLRNAIDWSYQLLPPEEQKLFVYLSVFSGSFSLDEVVAMFSRKVTVKPLPNLIALLLDKSLLKLAPDSEVKGETRYTMLVTIQEFAKEHLREMREETEIRDKHLTYFLALAQRADKELRGPNQVEWSSRLNTTRDNLRAALDWAIESGQTKTALQMACQLSWFWSKRSDFNEACEWLGRVILLPDAPQEPESYADALTKLAQHKWLQIGAKEARPMVEQALAIARIHDNTQNIAKALSILGLVLAHEHNYAAAQITLEESKSLFREADDQWGYAYAVACLGQVPLLQDDRSTALAMQEQALELFRKLGDLYFQSAALRLIGSIRVNQGDWPLGQAALREALTLAQQLDSKYEVALALIPIGDAAQAKGNAVRAVHLYQASKNIFDSIGVSRQDDESELEQKLSASRATLDESTFAQAANQGRAMTMGQAISYALDDQE